MKNLFLLALLIPLSIFAQQSTTTTFPTQPWKMHHIDRQFYNHNSISPADFNGDGFMDYVVIHEGPDKVTIIFHPGVNANLYKAWKKVVISEGNNVEYAYAGDMNGDGNLDIVYANGDKADVNILWGPGSEYADDPKKWADGGSIPSSKNQGHYVYLETFDINEDGALDIVTGGRRHKSGKLNGLIWYEAPAKKNDREDLSKWKMNSIDENCMSGHGFVIHDLNEDGHADIVLANADWDTPDHEEELVWYEHPGSDTDDIRSEWKKHLVFKSNQFFAKPQVGIGDLNNDRKDDLAVMTDNYIFYFEQQETAGKWRRTQVNKPEITRWVTRPIKIVDLNGDGKKDIVGMTIHNYGYTPTGKASVFWMEYEGDKPAADNWTTHVIKWSDGIFSGKTFQGEKWDHCRFVDLDRDGDLDIIANCEEYYKERKNSLLGVVWFENPTIE